MERPIWRNRTQHTIDPRSGAIQVNTRVWERRKFFRYSDGSVKYECTNADADAVETDETWDIVRTVFGVGGLEVSNDVRIGAVNSEAVVDALF